MGATEIVFIFLIYLLLFGAKGIPSMARTMGSAVREFRSATDEIQREILGTTDGIRDEVNKVRNAANPTTPPAKAKDEDSKTSESPAD